MPVINVALDNRKWILVRDQIATILKDELYNQSVITYEDWKDCDVYVERWRPITEEELLDTSVINISIEQIGTERQTIADSSTALKVSILIHTAMPATEFTQGDENSSERNQIIASLCQAILQHPLYVRLGFAPPFIEHKEVSEIKFGKSDRLDSTNISVAMLTVDVRFGQGEPTETGVALALSTTVMKIDNDGDGYKFVNS